MYFCLPCLLSRRVVSLAAQQPSAELSPQALPDDLFQLFQHHPLVAALLLVVAALRRRAASRPV